jgi:serine/threonine protein kinase/Tfp pilus assembly protein PilF
MARKIGHRHVGKMYELMEEKGTHFITMEYVSGQDLRGLIKQSGQLAVGTTIHIAEQVCLGLSEAHRLGVIHRDLKPSNIMIDQEGNALIMDFGIARSLEGKGITGAGVMIGTPEYMSPEQVEGKDTNQRSDIYSLGVILYEMLTGQVPFDGDTALTIAVKHKTEMPQDPKELNPQISEDLNSLILKCLQKDKENRFQTSDELRSSLMDIKEGIPTTEQVIPKKMPLTSKQVTVTFGVKRVFIPAAIFIGLIIAGIILWQLFRHKGAPPIPTDKPSIGILYFKNNTGDQEFDIWRTALSDSLIIDLSQSKHIRVLSADGLFSILKQMDLLEAENYTSEELKTIAARGRINHILQGNYSKAGDNFRIEITLQDANTMELIGSERVEGIGEKSIFSMVDDLTRRIKSDFKLTEEQLASDIDKKVGEITTQSPDAYKLYSQGRKYHYEGDLPRSVGAMQKAIAIDPEFAMAYRSAAASFVNMRLIPAAKKAFKKAFDLSDKASERESYIIKGDYYRLSEATYEKAIDAYKKLLENYPEDGIGNNNLGLLYRDLEEWDMALTYLEVLISLADESPSPYSNAAYAYAAKGLESKAIEVFENYLKNVGDHWVIRFAMSEQYICQGKYDLARSEWEKAISLQPYSNPPYILLMNNAIILQLTGNLQEAEEEYLRAMKSSGFGAAPLGRRYSVHINLLQGKFSKAKSMLKPRQALQESFAYAYLRLMDPQEALKECDWLWDKALQEENFHLQRMALHYKGLIYLNMKSINEAESVAEELRDLIENGINKKKIRVYHHLMGMIELEKENLPEAIDYFKTANSLLPHQYGFEDNENALFYDSLALAYLKAGDLAKAQEECEKITALTVGRLNFGKIHAKSFYMLGKIYEQKGDTAKAIEHYEKFLNLWKDADPGIAEVEDARKRLAGLKDN